MKRARYTKGISLSLSPEQYEKIKAITDEKEIAIAEWFRDVAEEALQSELSNPGPKEKRGLTRGGSRTWETETL